MRELLQQALGALEDAVGLHVRWDDAHAETITALREALAAPPAAPAPVVPLTQDQIVGLAANYEERYHRWVFICVDELEQFARAIEQAHNIGGRGE